MAMKTFLLMYNSDVLGEGFILPSNQVAFVWNKVIDTHCIYPSFESFEELQLKMGRDIVEVNSLYIEGYNTNTFSLVRNEDTTGISGVGLVAKGCCFTCGNMPVVMQWVTKFASINWYKSIKDIEKLHGHNGKTKVVMDASPLDLPIPFLESSKS